MNTNSRNTASNNFEATASGWARSFWPRSTSNRWLVASLIGADHECTR